MKTNLVGKNLSNIYGSLSTVVGRRKITSGEYNHCSLRFYIQPLRQV